LDLPSVKTAIGMLGINPESGLDHNDNKYLSILSNDQRPTGIKTLASATGIPQETIETIIEPHLIRQGYILKTPKGRILK